MKCVEVAVPVPVRGTFRYALADEDHGAAEIGRRLRVPFGGRHLIGYVVEVVADDAPPAPYALKTVSDVLDTETLFGADDLELYEWVSSYYLHPLGQVLRTALPSGATGAVVQARKHRVFVPTSACDDAEAMARLASRAPARAEALGHIRAAGRLAAEDLKARMGTRSQSAVAGLIKAGFVEVVEEETLRSTDGRAGMGPRESDRRPPDPTDAQAAVLGEIDGWLGTRSFAPVLLHGVTGSGKTEVYLRAIQRARAQNRGALVLVPEIALTPQLVERFYARFGEEIAVLHSGLSDGERFDAWRRIRRGDARIAIGARSAVFAPVRDLGVIVVDEEHEGSYKQEDGLRYNARDVAVWRARQSSAVCVLASATPSLETTRHAREERYRSLQLPERITGHGLPPVEIVPVRGASQRETFLSDTLREALTETLAAGRQALLLLNRRGYAPFVLCRDCGHTFQCEDCAVSLTFHAARGVRVEDWAPIAGLAATLRCHYCGAASRPPDVCPACSGTELRLCGAGTQRLERELEAGFPDARVARMDRDTTATRGAHGRILAQLERREIDILMGTQMIAKGLDFPHVTLVGVVLADAGLNVPDFRASERTFQLLTQVAGRAGRGEVAGRVIVQAVNPDHYAVRLAAEHDFAAFFTHEEQIRRELAYPPFARLVNIRVHGVRRPEVESHIRRVAQFCRQRAGDAVRVVGPAPAPLERIRKRWRWQLLLKGEHSGTVRRLARQVLEECSPPRRDQLRLDVDVDPQSLL